MTAQTGNALAATLETLAKKCRAGEIDLVGVVFSGSASISDRLRVEISQLQLTVHDKNKYDIRRM